jgi:hypothetical protein
MVLYCCLEWLEAYVPILPLQSTIFFQKVLFEFKGCYSSKVQQCNTRIWNRDWNVVRLIIINEIATRALENINWFLEVDSQIDNPCT